MAATVMASLTIPRSLVGLAAVSSPAGLAAPLPLRIRGNEALRPEFRGLRIATRPPIPASMRTVAAGSRPIRRGSVVCMAQGQGTAIQVPDVTRSTWKSLILECDMPVLVEFWASWCGPCRMIDPVISKLSKEYKGKLKCYRLNTDENPDVAAQYGIRSIPTMVVFKNGEKKDAVIGAVPESMLISCIEKFVGAYK